MFMIIICKHIQSSKASQSQMACEASMGGGNLFTLDIWVTLPRWQPRPYIVKPEDQWACKRSNGPVNTHLTSRPGISKICSLNQI